MTPPPRPAEAPCLGIGVGLRPKHFPDVLERGPRGALGVDWFEALSENYMADGGRPRRILDNVRAFAPIALHGVSLNIGSADPLDRDYLRQLRALAGWVEPAWLSDHLCWTGVVGHNLHDLIPLPYTEEVATHVAARLREVQERLGRRIAIENVSSYLSYAVDAMSEWEFLSAVANEADCGILLDVNNVFVSAHNHRFDALEYIRAIPPERIFQLHLAGHSESGPLLIDTHDHPIRSEVWELYEQTLRHSGPVSTLIEWDDEIPDYDGLVAEAERARAIWARLAAELGWEEAAHREPRAAR